MSDVFESCMCLARDPHAHREVVRVEPARVVMHGPSGANVSKLLPRMNWPPELRCAVRAETSLRAVMPPIAARAEARSARRVRAPMTSAISAS